MVPGILDDIKWELCVCARVMPRLKREGEAANNTVLLAMCKGKDGCRPESVRSGK